MTKKKLASSASDMAKASHVARRRKAAKKRRKVTPVAATDLEGAIREQASVGAEAADIATACGVEKRLLEDADFRVRFERLIDQGQADFRIAIARKIQNEALDGRAQITALKQLAEAWLVRHMDETPMIDFATGTADRILSLVRKHKKGKR